ncbi:hypothetical protein PAEPH01_2622, partial [Pancytospora epiphaga]
EAHARVRFSGVVEALDVKEAERLIKESLLLYAIDPRTGKIDVNMIFTGRSASKVRLIEDLKKAILGMVKTKMSLAELSERTKAEGRLLQDALGELDLEGTIYYNKQSGNVERVLRE